jgi:Protein of unknown function (DUF455)
VAGAGALKERKSMPIVDRRDFGGRFSVIENSERLANYRYLEEQLMEMIGGWSQTTPALAHKAAFGYHVYGHAQAATLLGERLRQLRSGGGRSRSASDDFSKLCEHVWNLDDVVERLVAVYRVLEPHLVSTYVYHADATDPLTDAPTVRLLRQLGGMDQSHIAWGQAVLDSLTQSRAERERAIEVQADIEGRLVECGGVTGQGIESHWLSFHSAKDRDRSHQRHKRLKTGYHFAKSCPERPSPAVEEPFWFSHDREAFRVYESEDEWSLEGFRHKFHQLLYGEVETTDRMGKMLAEYPDLPWDMRMDLATQMWDEARHIEIVAKAVEEELGGELGYGPWPYVWWWMQNESDPLRRITVTNCWAEANLMNTLKQWRVMAIERGFERIAELCDYLQADELMHVKTGTKWLRRLTDSQPERRDELAQWGRTAVARIEGFYDGDEAAERDVRFTFKGGSGELFASPSDVVGE